MAVDLQGNIIDEQGKKLGGKVDVITGQMLTPQPTQDYSQPSYPALTTPEPDAFAPTPAESKISGQIADISKEAPALANETAAFRTSEEQRLGLEGLKTGEADLYSQLQQQKAEFDNLTAEDARIEERQQQQATGRGITSGGLQPLTAAELRKNFLLKSEKAAQVNVTAALLAGTQNKLLTAQSLIDRAVQNKFGAREAELKAKKDNLDLLLRDPSLTNEQSKRAAKQAAALKKETDAIDKEKENQKAIWDIAVESTRNIKNIQNADPTLLAKIQGAKTKEEALKIAGDAGLLATKVDQPTSVQEYEYAKANGYTGTFSDYQNEDANRKARVAAASNANGLNPATTQKVLTIANQFDGEQVVKDYNTISQQVNAVRTAGITPTDDIQRVYAFAKVMDPNSVVREGEYKTVQDYSQAVLQAYGLRAERVFDNRGFLTTEARNFILNTLENRLNATASSYQNVYNEYGRRINKITGMNDGTDYITNYAGGYENKTEQPKLVYVPNDPVYGPTTYQLGDDGTYYPIGSGDLTK